MLGTALVGRIFVLTEPQLMLLPWFARAMGWWRATKARVRAAVTTSPTWRLTRLSVRRWRPGCASGGARTPDTDLFTSHAMPIRIHLPEPLHAGAQLTLPPGASRHVQVLRMQPGEALVLFNGQGGEWSACITRMGRQSVDVEVQAHVPTERELACAVTLALGMPANDRMDSLVEKATELGVAVIQPLVCERSVLRLAGERAERKQAHWQGIAAAASEQSGRTRVPVVAPVLGLGAWLQALAPAASHQARWVLSLRTPLPFGQHLPGGLLPASACFLSGPEGGLTEAEEALATGREFVAVSLGARTLRADTAPLAALAWLALQSPLSA